MLLKHHFVRAFAVATLVVCVGIGKTPSAQTFTVPPTPSTLVNDYAGLLTQGERQALELKLNAFNDSTSTQIAVVIFQSLNGADPGDAATQIGREWGVGQAGGDNGAVLLVSLDDRKLFIATGYGMEAVVTDAQAGRIIRNVIAPRFRTGSYYIGLDEATDALMAAASGEFSIDDRIASNDSENVWPVLLFILIVFIVLIIFAKSDGSGGGGVWISTGSGGWSSGGGFSGGGGFGGFGGGGFGGGGAGGGW